MLIDQNLFGSAIEAPFSENHCKCGPLQLDASCPVPAHVAGVDPLTSV
jgi:hypothetical protein